MVAFAFARSNYPHIVKADPNWRYLIKIQVYRELLIVVSGVYSLRDVRTSSWLFPPKYYACVRSWATQQLVTGKTHLTCSLMRSPFLMVTVENAFHSSSFIRAPCLLAWFRSFFWCSISRRTRGVLTLDPVTNLIDRLHGAGAATQSIGLIHRRKDPRRKHTTPWGGSAEIEISNSSGGSNEGSGDCVGSGSGDEDDVRHCGESLKRDVLKSNAQFIKENIKRARG